MTSTAQSPRARFTARPAAWLDRWGSIVPLLAAEFIVWLGFGALLLEVERQDREQRAEPEPHDELGDQQRDDRAPAIEPRGGSGR